MNPDRLALGHGWTLWRHALLRGAGFPFALMDDVFRSPGGADALWDVAADPRVREAVSWQNRPAVENGFDWLLRRPRGTENAKVRQVQALVASYLQRYCAKNDTVGFFGPLGWVSVGGTPHFEAGVELVSSRVASLEPWAVLAIERAGGDDGERLRAPVQVPGHLRPEPGGVLGPTRFTPLTGEEQAVVAGADGRPAADVLAGLRALHGTGADWLGVLRRLVADGIVRWEFPVTVSHRPAQRWEDLGGSPALAAVQARLEDVRRAAGDAAALSTALVALEREFEARTSRPAWRNPGRTYAGRGLVVEECRRDVTMDLGRRAVERVAAPLAAVLRVARWYTFTVARHLAASLRAVHRGLGGGTVPLHVLWACSSDLFDHEVPVCVGAARREVWRRWEDMWATAEPGSDGLYLDPAVADAYVADRFDAPCPGWPGARHHAPDLMWQAATAEDVLAGRGTPVLGELHPGVTPFTTLSVLAVCPVRRELEAEWAVDFPGPLVSPVPSEEFARSTLDARLATDHWHLDVGAPFASDRPAGQVVRAADFDVVEHDGRLVAVHRDGGPVLDLLAVFERRIKLRAAAAFSLGGGTGAGARRYLGPLLVQRAHWTIDETTCAAVAADGVDGLRAWRASNAVPERVFVRSPREVKPVYVDFASPVSSRLLGRLARRAPTLTVSEMYPDPSGLWLRDGDGRSYTGELRFVAVDPAPFDAAAVWATGAARRSPAAQASGGSEAIHSSTI